MSQSKEPRVLLIEADQFLAGIYKKKFEMEGFKVHTAEDGIAGLEAVEKKHPSIILLDILLPKLDGFSVLEELKKNHKTQHIPVIFLTNLGQKQDVQKAFQLGADDYLIKTHFKPSELVDKVKHLLELSHS